MMDVIRSNPMGIGLAIMGCGLILIFVSMSMAGRSKDKSKHSGWSWFGLLIGYPALVLGFIAVGGLKSYMPDTDEETVHFINFVLIFICAGLAYFMLFVEPHAEDW